MTFTDEQYDIVKLYLKVSQDIEKTMIIQMMISAGDELAKAISSDMTAEDFLNDDRFKSRFFTALLKQVKEEYDYRGLGSEVMRFPIQTPVVNIINQIRAELVGDTDAH